MTRFDPALRNMSVVVALGAIMTVLDTTIVNVAVHVLGRDLHTSLSTIQWVLTGYTLALSMTIPVTGWAVDRFGARRLWITSLAVFIAGSVLCGFAWSAVSLIAFRVLQGVGGGLLMPVGQTMLARAAGPDRMGRVMAVVSIPAMLAPALGPVFGGVLLDHLSWRWLFFVNVPVCAAALLLAIRLLPRVDAHRGTAITLDGWGFAMLSPGLAMLVYGLAQAGDGAHLSSPRVFVGLAAGAALLGAFTVRALRRGDRALVDVRLFGSRPFATAVTALLFYSVGMFGVLILVPLYDQTVRGGDALDAGLLTAPLGIGAILSMPLAGRFVDRAGSRLPGIAGVLVVLLGTSAFTLVDSHVAVPLLATAVFVIGLGHGMIIPSLLAGAYKGLPRLSIPNATTAASIMVRVGSALGGAVLAVVLQIALRHADHLAVAFATSFWWALGLTAVSLIPAVLIPRPAPTAADPRAVPIDTA
jgi:EmrB/QacA subfamily drug resistance transporter